MRTLQCWPMLSLHAISSFPIQKQGERSECQLHNEWQFTYNVVLIYIDLRW
jgi:hypothetical protein